MDSTSSCKQLTTSISNSRLFQPIRIGNTTQLAHRVVFAPLTRFRANKAHAPTDLHVEYYSQRASVPGTLLITEGTYISPNGAGQDNIPGIWSDAQITAWKRVTDAVHARQSSIYMQIWALGRAAEPTILALIDDDERNPGGPYPYVSASSVPLSDRRVTGPSPRALTNDEIENFIGQFTQAAKNAIAAGFDGVEIHAVHGYLIDQFTQSNTNKREDQWGGDVKGRTKFALAVVDAVASAIGPEKTAIRVSPWSTYLDMRMSDGDVYETFSYLIRSIRDKYPTFSYLHAPEPRVTGPGDRLEASGESNDFMKDIWLNEGNKPHNRVYIAAGGYTVPTALRETEVRDKVLVAFGRYFSSNPDLVARIKNGIPFTPYNRQLFYVPEVADGYTDFEFADKDAELHYKLAKQY